MDFGSKDRNDCAVLDFLMFRPVAAALLHPIQSTSPSLAYTPRATPPPKHTCKSRTRPHNNTISGTVTVYLFHDRMDDLVAPATLTLSPVLACPTVVASQRAAPLQKPHISLRLGYFSARKLSFLTSNLTQFTCKRSLDYFFIT